MPETTSTSNEVSTQSQHTIIQEQTNTEQQTANKTTMETNDDNIGSEVAKTDSAEASQGNESLAMEKDRIDESSEQKEEPVSLQSTGTASTEVVDMETKDDKEISGEQESKLSPQMSEAADVPTTGDIERVVFPEAMEVEPELSRDDPRDQESNTDANISFVVNQSEFITEKQAGILYDNSRAQSSPGSNVMSRNDPQEQPGNDLNTNVNTPEKSNEIEQQEQLENTSDEANDQTKAIIAEKSNDTREDPAEIPRDKLHDRTDTLEESNVKEKSNQNIRDDHSGTVETSCDADRLSDTENPILNQSSNQQENEEILLTNNNDDPAVTMETEQTVTMATPDNNEHLNADSKQS